MLASAVTADTYFDFGRTIDASDQLKLGLITAEADGVVEIYDYRLGAPGALLGSETIHAGANPDVRVDTGRPVSRDILAVVRIDGEIVAEKEFDIRSD